MEIMPYQPQRPCGDGVPAWAQWLTVGLPTGDWTTGLPALAEGTLTLRELTLEDAPSLFAHLTTEEVARFISPPPTRVEGFEDFIRWTHLRRSQGRYACFGIGPAA